MNNKKTILLLIFLMFFMSSYASAMFTVQVESINPSYYMSQSLSQPVLLASNTTSANYDLFSLEEETTETEVVDQDYYDDWPEEFWDHEPPELFEPDPNDLDRDGLTNQDEEYYNTDPYNPDSDNDGITDLHEIANGTDPNSPDTIGYEVVEHIIIDSELESSTDDTFDDEITGELDEADEIIFDDSEIDFDPIPPSDYSNDKLESPALMESGIDGGTTRTSSSAMDMTPIFMLLLLGDNDGDGMEDDWEIRHFGSIDNCDPEDDPDYDGLSNLNEFKCYSDPNNPDSDSDGLTDGFEFVNGMDPTSTDSDEDLMPDYYEVTNSLNPIEDDSRGNLDNDSFTNYQEYILGTDPNDNTDSPTAPDDVDLGFDYDEHQGGGGLVGETIRIFNGNVIEYRSDVSFSSPNQLGLSLDATYNSQSNNIGSMGYGWTHTYEVFLYDNISLGSLTLLKITDSTGHAHYFYEEATDIFTGLFAEKSNVKAEGGGYTWYSLEGIKYGFSSSGLLLWMDDPAGNRLNVTYNSNNKLEKVTDNAGTREITFFYDGDFIDYVTGPVTTAVADGIWVDYTCNNTTNNLTSVTYADNSGFDYTYGDTSDTHNLTQKHNKAGYLINTWTYNTLDQATANYSRDGKGVDLITYQTSTQIDITDAYNKTRSYYLTESSTRNRVESITESGGRPGAIPWDSDNAVYWDYDNCMNPVEIEYAGGAVNLYENYDARGNPGKVYLGWNDTEETALRIIEYTYHPELNTPLTRTEPSILQAEGYKRTIWDYDDPTDLEDDPYIYNENPTNLPYAILEKGYTKDSAGSIVSYTYTTRLTYNTGGQVLTVNGPRDEVGGVDDLITLSYNSTTGDLLSVTRPHIGAASYSGYDSAGQAGTVTDVNNQSKTYTYDGRGRVTGVTNNADSSNSSVTYNNAGEVSTRTDEDDITTTYLYNYPLTDTGHLYRILDSESNYIEYSYDDEGNVEEKGYYQADATLTKKTNYLYQHAEHNMPGLLYKEINADNTFTKYTYFPSGNVQYITDPENNSTEYTYDDLNRVKTITLQYEDASQALVDVVTTYSYDGHGNLASVEDAKEQTTSYTYDDMGRLVTTTSPDTGTVSYVYDESGNPVSKTDNKGITVTYEYDFLNRLTYVNFPDYVLNENETLPAYNITYSYDSGANGMGRRTGITGQSGSTVFGYDNRGRLASKITTVDSQTYTLSRTFTDAGRVETITYPSTRVVYFQRNGSCACKVSDVVTTYNSISTTLFGNLDYRPFGGARGLSTGGGGSVSSTFNTTGRMTVSNPGATHEKTFDYDNTGNITSITAPSLPHQTRVFVYDELYRLKQATASGAWGTIDYEYDDAGNRESRTIDSITESYNYVTGTNIIDSITTGTSTIDYSNDLNGNITAIDDKALIYNQNNRMIRVEDYNSILGAYTYNGLGQRIKKTADSTTTVFHYDFDGNIIGESDLSGTFAKEYIYKGSSRVALVDYSTDTNGEIYFYGNDTLGTPLILTDSTNTVIWEATYKPFGEAEVNPNSTVESNHRFKGQYYDSETGFHYNYHRYYDPSTGRYLTPDPIGQFGGINIYLYVKNNPINLYDPFGLKVRFAKGSSSTFKAQFAQAINYLNKGKVSGPIAKLEKLPQIVYIKEPTAGSNDMYYDPNTQTIVWDPLSALKCSGGGKQTPALGLLHESVHALGDLTGTAASTAAIPGDPYGNAEEKRVIDKYETPAAKKLGEGTRKDHYGTPYQTTSPISR